jgi:peptidoglycan/LPS O-acetylase OafA/YrhL
MKNTNYRPEIDGLRTVAVIAVILFHLNSSWLIGGYYGVDVFFVISGYLITGILIKNIENNTFSMIDFWLRRVKRIIPLLLTVIFTTILVFPFFMFLPEYSVMLKDITPALFSYFNFHAYSNFGNYWGHTADQSFFLHTWSLSVEEQFYLFYPLTLIIVHKYFKTFLIPLIVITFISLGLFMCFVNIKTPLTFYMLPFRVWELSIGGVIVCLPKNINLTKSTKNLISLLGLILILVSYFFASQTISYIAILPVLGAFLIIYFSAGEYLIGKLLSSKIFVHIGKLSYSLYLWHWPILVLFKNLEFKFIGVNKLYVNALILVITYILSYLTYRFIETKLRHYNTTPRLVLLGIIGCVLLLAFFRSSYFNIHYTSLYNKQTYYLKYYDLAPNQGEFPNDNLAYNVIVPDRLKSFVDAYKNEGIKTVINNTAPKILLLGDSHGTMWAKTLQNVCKELHISSSIYATDAIKPFFNIKNLDNQKSNALFSKKERTDYAKSIVRNIDIWKIKTLIISCRWEQLSDEDKYNFKELIKYLKNKNIKVLIINQPPRISIMEDHNASQFISYLKIKPTKGFNSLQLNQEDVIKGNKFIKELSVKYSNIFIFDAFGKLYENGKVKITLNKEVLYFDDDHLSYYCTELFKEDLKKVIKGCVK